jgi:glycosyltransferase involved in cell wall biosynthesis
LSAEAALNVTVIIPFHRNLSHLGESLPAARRSMPDAELLIAADGAIDDCRLLAAAWGAQVIVVPGPSGPAVARNRAAALAGGDILAFVDADVVVAPEALPGMCRLLEMETDLDGVFGAYDLVPPEPNFMSQYKNLSHAYIHEVGDAKASTFWAGLGAIRTDAFRAVGGFDERFRRPSIEDVELGYRLVAAGYTLRLDTRFRGRHLKRWTLGSSVVTDIYRRGIPWTQLIHRSQALSNDLNTSIALRLSVALTGALAASLALAVVTPWAAIVAAGLVAALVGLNFRYYRWFARTRGFFFAVRVIPVHLVHHLCNGMSFVAGTALHLAARSGVSLPGALPTTVWAPQPIAARARPRARSRT